MENIEAVAYVSTAVRHYTETALEALLADAREFNARLGVTGALLHHEATFFQYFEGAADAVAEVYERIKRSSSHRDIVELLHEEVPRREFSIWHMGFAQVPRSLVLQLEQAQWSQAAGARSIGTATAHGVDLLLQFWRRVRRLPPT